jgi:hypothetical protein
MALVSSSMTGAKYDGQTSRATRSLTAAYHAHPERFVRKPPAPPKLPGTSWINPPQDKETGTQ